MDKMAFYLASKRRFQATVDYAISQALRVSWDIDNPSYQAVRTYVRYMVPAGISQDRFAAQVYHLIKFGRFPDAQA
jgi:hypothetical protein